VFDIALYESTLAGIGSLFLWFIYFKRKDWLKMIIIGGIFFFAGVLLLDSVVSVVLTYFSWQTNPVSKFLLPPYQSAYFARYCFFHYFASNLITIGGACLLGLISWILFKRGWITKTAIYLLVLSGLVVGWANFILWIGILSGLILIQKWIFPLKKREALVICLLIALTIVSWWQFWKILVEVKIF
jgi:hypothetical protein